MSPPVSAAPTDTILLSVQEAFADTALAVYPAVQPDPGKPWLAFCALVLVIALIFVLREATRDGINPP